MTKNVMINHEIETSVITKPTRHKPKSTIAKPKAFEWINDQNHPIRGEIALWVAVITQAMMDALSRSNNSETRYFKHEAINWLTGNSKNFIMVCHNAGLDPDYVRKKAKRALVSPQNWRAEAGKGKRYLERKSYRKCRKEKDTETVKNNPTELHTENVIVGRWGV